MRPWSVALRGLLPLLLALAGVGALGIAAAIFHGATRPRAVQGFVRLETQGGSCTWSPAWERSATRTVAPEPFVPEEDQPARCRLWRASWLVSRPTRLELELEAAGDASVMLDGGPLVTLPGAHGRAARAQIWDVEPGVHTLEVRSAHTGGPAYLRVRAQDRRDSYMAGVLPLDRDAFFLSAFDAERAREQAWPPRRTPLRSLAFGLALAAAGVLFWLAIRAHRQRDRSALARLAAVDLALALGLCAVALAIRSALVSETDLAWDELWYWNAGEHYVRNALLGDWAAESFRWNREHPPIAKWIYGLGGAIGGLDGARQLGCVLSAASVGFTYGTGRVLFDRRAAIGAALVTASMPHLVAHGRLVGLETVVVFFWTANLLALALWLRSLDFGGYAADRLRREDGLAAFMGGWLFVPGLLSRLTYLWMAVVALFGVAWGRRSALGRGALAVPAAALLGMLVSSVLCVALWPWVWTDPVAHLSETYAHWGGRTPTEYFLGRRTVGPPFSYYAVLFAVTTPALALLAALFGAARGLGARRRAGTLLVLVALLAPFLQSLSSFRQDLARYVVQAWPAVALLAGILVSDAGRWLAVRARDRSAVPGLAVAPSLALGLYVAAQLGSVEPFPLDYYGEHVGGPGNVARLELFDISWWAEGGGHAVRWLNEHARHGARVRIDTSNWDVRPRLRDDLVEVQFRSQVPADYVVVNYHLYGDPPPASCIRVHHVEVRGAQLASVYECPPAGARSP